MKLITLIAIALCLCTLSSFAQSTYSIKGITVDSTSKAKVPTTVAVWNAKDSILRKFTRTAPDGSFTITGLPAGRFLLLVMNPDYTDYSTIFTLDPLNKSHDFGNIKLTIKALMLKEVAIKGSQVDAIKIKGDTIEYNAKRYVVQPNDKVEDMLRQLPGVEVDAAGHITAQGERVQKVLLDGEEFFGDDPLLITRNIRGDMVDKIQIYNKKSDQATFTGVDDGVKIKTLNVVLKEDRRVGTFGKVSGGAGTRDYYEGQGIANKFTANYKAALYGTKSNDGVVGLGFADNNRIGVTNSLGGAADQLDNSVYNGIGLPQAQTVGVHYDSKWNKNKESINANYKEGSLSNTTDEDSKILITLPGGTQFENKNQHIYQDLSKQKLDGTYQKTFSPMATIKIDVDGAIRHTENASTKTDSLENANGTPINTVNSNDHSKAQEKIFNTHILFNQRLKSKQSFSFEIRQTYNETNATENIYSNSHTSYNNGNTVIDQYKPSTVSALTLGSNIIFTQPLSPKMGMLINHGFNIGNTASDTRSFDQSSPGVYNVLDSIYSNNYKVQRIANQIGIMFAYRSSTKFFMFFGNRGSIVNYRQTNEYTGGVFKRSFVQWDPEADLTYQIAQSKGIIFEYTGHTQQLSISQLQPVTNNTNQLYIVVGNPNLRPAFSNNFIFSYNSRQQLTGQTFFANGGFTFVADPIISTQAENSKTGVTTSQAVNLDGKTQYNYNFNLNEGIIIKPWDLRVNGSLSASGSVSYSQLNNILQKNAIQTYSPSINLSKAKLKKYTLSASIRPIYTINNIVTDSTVSYKTFGFSTSGRVLFFLPAKLQISSDIQYTYTGPTSGLPATYKTMLNGAINRTFLKGDNIKLSLSGLNLLNQDQNTRFPSGNRITQTNYNTLGRYFMFSISWDFTKFGTIPAKN